MKILVDENIPSMTVRALRAMGHGVRDIRGTPDEGMVDEALWQKAQSEERLLMSTDKGFVSRRNTQHHGAIIVRLRRPNRRKIHERIMQAMAQFSEADWRGVLVVMRDEVQSVWRARQNT